MTEESEDKPELPPRMDLDIFFPIAISSVIAFFFTCGATADAIHTGRGIPGENAIASGIMVGMLCAATVAVILNWLITKLGKRK